MNWKSQYQGLNRGCCQGAQGNLKESFRIISDKKYWPFWPPQQNIDGFRLDSDFFALILPCTLKKCIKMTKIANNTALGGANKQTKQTKALFEQKCPSLSNLSRHFSQTI